MIQNVSEKV